MKTTILADITLKIGSGATPRGGKRSYKKNGISLIRSQLIYDFHFVYDGLVYIDEKQGGLLSNVIVEKDDILLNITGASVARCCIVPSKILPARVNQHVSIIRVDRQKADPRYVLYCINSNKYKQKLLSIAQSGATREALTKEKIENFEIPLPPLITQRKIATILSAYDDLIENNLRRIQILDEIAQSLYREWFVHFRFPGHESVRKLESELGKIPEGWKITKIGDLTEFSKGKKPKVITELGNIPVLLIESLNSGVYKYTNDNSMVVAESEDVIMVMDGASSGKVYIGHYGAAGSTVGVYRLKDRLIYSSFLLYFLLLNNFQTISDNNTGTAIPHANKEFIKQLKAVIPSEEILYEFDKNINPIFDLISNLKKKNILLGKTRDLLLPKLITGELNVSGLDIK